MQLYRSGTVEPRCNEVLAITNDFLYPSNSKRYEKEPRYNETSLSQTNFASPLVLGYIEVPLVMGTGQREGSMKSNEGMVEGVTAASRSGKMNQPKSRLRVVPHFSSGIVEQAHVKITPREKRRHAFFSRGAIFTRARVSLALLFLRKNGGLLVV